MARSLVATERIVGTRPLRFVLESQPLPELPRPEKDQSQLGDGSTEGLNKQRTYCSLPRRIPRVRSCQSERERSASSKKSEGSKGLTCCSFPSTLPTGRNKRSGQRVSPIDARSSASYLDFVVLGEGGAKHEGQLRRLQFPSFHPFCPFLSAPGTLNAWNRTHPFGSRVPFLPEKLGLHYPV